MNDFRLRVFISVAQNLSFTAAANELNVSQPAISKHIQELENMYHIQLFERSAGSIRTTHFGDIFLKHALSIIESYRTLQLEMNLLTQNFKGELHIGASTTIAQYVIAPIIAKFIVRFPDIRVSLMGGNTRQIERALSEHRIDIGLIEGRSRRSALRYSHFMNDSLVVVTAALTSIPATISLSQLSLLPLVLREVGSGTLEVIERTLAGHGLKLSSMNIILHMGSTESIKQFLCHSSSFAIVSVVAVEREIASGLLKVVKIEGVDFEREFAFVSLMGVSGELGVVAEKFEHFAEVYNQKL
ncbi:MAG: LysR substrate-binding domain-containing protein [Mucinivorans sp.]